jgi:hypothetical protein
VFEQLGETLTVRGSVRQVEVQDLELDDPPDAAVERALGYLPGADVFVDRSGRYVLRDTLSGGESEVLSRLTRRQVSDLDATVVDRSALRPSEVIVLFTPEPEGRLEAQEGGTQVRDTMTMVNKAPVPDPFLLVDGVKVGRGTYLALEALFTAWGAFGAQSRLLSIEILRRNAFKHGAVGVEDEFGHDPTLPPDALNALRARVAVDAFRATYEIDRDFWSRVAALRPYRAAVLNTQTGVRAPAEVFCDWTRRPSLKGRALQGDANVNAGWAVRGWAALLKDAKAMPGRDGRAVAILDPSAGVIRLMPGLDPYGNSQTMALGYPDGGLMPSQLLGDANRNADDLYAQWDLVELEAGFRASVVLTAIPASPNDSRRLHALRVPSGLATQGRCTGPPIYVRVFPGIMTARYRWDDAQSAQILGAFKGQNAWPDALLVNRQQVLSVGLAAARRVYDALADRPDGGAQVDLDPELEPSGTCSSVVHALDSGGATITRARFTSARVPADLWRYLDASTRKAINRVLLDGTGP